MTNGTPPPVLRSTGVSRSFSTGAGEVHAVRDANLEVRAGELLVLRGPSGSGKTTLLNILGGLDRPTSGEVWLGDRELTRMTEKELIEVRRRELGYVFQGFGLIPVLSAAENVEVPLRILELPANEREQQVAEMLELVGLSEHSAQRPYELSGGQQQRVGLARALASKPSILLADEPTGQLDSGTAGAMMDLITRLVHSTGIAAVVSTHDPLMMSRADTVLEIHDGHLRPTRHGRHAAATTPAG